MKVAAAAAALCVALLAGDAEAFCSRTTCNPKTTDCAADARGCATVGAPLRWSSTRLTYRFHHAGTAHILRAEARAAVRSAFHRWSDTLCPDGRRTSLRFEEGEDLEAAKPWDGPAAESHGIYFLDLGWPHSGADEVLAKTNTFFTKSGKITYADIEINSGTKPFSVGDSALGYDLQSVMTHEVGHYIGLAHSVEDNSIMAEAYCESGDRCSMGQVAARRLAADDIEGLCNLFPPDGAFAPPADGGGCQASAATSGASGASTAALAIVGLMMVMAARRRWPRAAKQQTAAASWLTSRHTRGLEGPES